MSANVEGICVPKGLPQLEEMIRRDLDILDYPKRRWVRSRKTSSGQNIYDVVIVGGGQGGLATAFGLLREKITNILIVDENPDYHEGPWRTFARMQTLRTPKYLTGPDYGIPSLTIRSWYEAQHGQGSWDALRFVPKGTWADYLRWFRDFLKIPVRNLTKAGALEWVPEENCFAVPLSRPIGLDVVYARKVILATGIDGSGQWDVPDVVKNNLPPHLYAHTRQDIIFKRLVGKKVGVLGAGASAFDNASVALEEGAGEVRLFFRRKELVRVNPYRWAEFAGFLKHHADLDDAQRWKFIHQIVRMGQLPPSDTYARANAHANFHMHPATSWDGVEEVDDRIRLTTNNGVFDLDFMILGTGFRTDLSLRKETKHFYERIAIWSDRYTPPPDLQSEDLARHPYLGPNFEFQERTPGDAPFLNSIFNFTFGGLVSLGFGGASISGMKYGLPRLISGVTKQLYRDDAELFYDDLMNYDEREF